MTKEEDKYLTPWERRVRNEQKKFKVLFLFVIAIMICAGLVEIWRRYNE